MSTEESDITLCTSILGIVILAIVIKIVMIVGNL
jgi:hypothetical protein